QPPGAVGAATRIDAGGAGGRVRTPRRGTALGADRGDLPAAARRTSRRDPAPAAARGGRSRRRPAAGVASSRAARDRGRGCDPGSRGRPARVRRPRAVSSPAGALGGLPLRVTPGETGG